MNAFAGELKREVGDGALAADEELEEAEPSLVAEGAESRADDPELKEWLSEGLSAIR